MLRERVPMLRRLVLLAAAAAVVGCGEAPPSDTPGAPCNGTPALCDRRLDEVAFPVTHNAMSSQAAGFLAPNQYEDVPTQLADGIRGLMLDVHPQDGEPYLCHSDCTYGSQPLVDGLRQIRDFLAANPREVLVIVFESYVPAADVEAAFTDAGLDGYLHHQTAGDPWPTLGEMVDDGGRLVVFTDDEGVEDGWYLDVWAYAVETKFHYESPGEMDCTPNRGDPANALFIFNHFLTAPLASPYLAEQVNYDPFFIDRARSCRDAFGRMPNFVTVDFYSIGDLFDVVDTLNAEGPPSP